MIVYIYNIGVDLYNGFNGLRHRINWTYFTVLDGLAHPLYSLAIKIVDSVEEAIEHISKHSTKHSESILTTNKEHARLFTQSIDSAAVYVNCSTRFTDGGQFGLGCEIGIST